MECRLIGAGTKPSMAGSVVVVSKVLEKVFHCCVARSKVVVVPHFNAQSDALLPFLTSTSSNAGRLQDFAVSLCSIMGLVIGVFLLQRFNFPCYCCCRIIKRAHGTVLIRRAM